MLAGCIHNIHAVTSLPFFGVSFASGLLSHLLAAANFVLFPRFTLTCRPPHISPHYFFAIAVVSRDVHSNEIVYNTVASGVFFYLYSKC